MATGRQRSHFLIPLMAAFIDGFKRSFASGVSGIFTDPNHAHNVTDGGHTHAVVTRRVGVLGVLPAGGANYVPQYGAGAAIDDAVGPFAQFLPARTVRVVAGALAPPTLTVTIDGTDSNGDPLQEIIPVPAPGAVEGARAFATITRVRTNEDPLDTLDVRTGNGFGLGRGTTAIHAVSVDGAVEAPASTHAGTGTVVPTSAPNGARAFAAEASFTQTSASGTTGIAATDAASTGIIFAPAGAVVHHDQDERAVSAAAASSLSTSLTLCKALLVAYAAHRVDTLHHQAADATNTVASGHADVVDLPTAIVAANELKTAYNAHRSEAGVHWSNDAGNAITSPDASDQGTLNTLLNELKADVNGHFATGQAEPVSWRVL